MRCRRPSDLHSRPARETIAKLLSKELKSWNLTPIELLHDLASYKRLSNAGTALQRAVQKAASQQPHETSEPISKRIRALNDVIDAAVRELHRLEKERTSQFTDLTIEDAAVALEKDEDRVRVFGTCLAARLRACSTEDEKLEALVYLLESSLPDWTLPSLDAFLAERLILGNGLDNRFGTEPLAQRLETCLKLGTGTLFAPQDLSEPLSRANAAIAAGRLPEASSRLIDCAFSVLATNRRITKGAMVKEFAALARLLAVAGDGCVQERTRRSLQDALEKHCARLLHSQTLASDLEKVDYLADRIDRLLDLADYAIGSRNLATIGERVDELLRNPETREFWTDPVGASCEQRMKTAARLQRRVLAGHMPETARDLLAGRFDRICADLLERSKLIERIESDNSSSTERSKRLLRLLAETHVTQGVASRRVRASIGRCFSDPNFLQPFEQAESAAKRKALMQDFHQLLSKAGLAGESDAASPTHGLTNFNT